MASEGGDSEEESTSQPHRSVASEARTAAGEWYVCIHAPLVTTVECQPYRYGGDELEDRGCV